MTALAINGFGRIGRMVLRAARGNPAFDVRAINDVTDAKTIAHLFKYDSTYGHFAGEVGLDGDHLVVDGKRIRLLMEKDPAKLPWRDLGVDVALECSGHFNTTEGGQKHLEAGAKKVFFSGPTKGEGILTVVKGVNLNMYDKKKHNLVSNASCTTNCLAPVIKVLHEKFGFKYGLMNTIHAFTNDQRTLDQPHSDLRRARTATASIIPTTTGAAKAIGLVMPELKGKIDGISLRVPTQVVSVVDLTCTLAKSVTKEEVNKAFEEAANGGPLKGVLGYSVEPLVSVDYKGDPRSSIVDAESTGVIGGDLVKVLAWYDNEWGFSNRMVEVSTTLM